MVDPPPSPEPKPPSLPRWVKLLGIIVAAVVIVAIVVLVFADGDHGPGRHMPGGDSGGHTPSVQHSR